MAGYQKSSDKYSKFDWKLFWAYLKPNIWYFLAAVVGALVVAIINIQIPQVMGGVINVLAKFSESKDSELFIKDIKSPAIKLTSDIQDFKSSFKQIVSGGLRATTQIIGCSVSLVLISPQMTFVTLLYIPCVVAVGTVFGALLRSISRRAQSQVEKTTAVADEAIGNIRTVRAFAMESQEFINLKPTMPLRGGSIIPSHKIQGHIEFKNVTFAYPTRAPQPVLEDFNLTVPSGKTIAIVGASDGHDIRTLHPSWLRRRALGLISQEPVPFGTSVMENIRYGRPEATDEEVRQAALLANADAFILAFLMDNNTLVGERGATLSGGQKQEFYCKGPLKESCRFIT
ncbi:hypothetical protein NQ314_016988 [Rhamnusium bicolor]|uniref:ABC transmembrane type-1 domain-containing protein n=1 Tax=Rhamnusium bicolor TaxID=1586634 RepID=A0AAV8WUT9_9CUCU|nr:hypothetical protein NQ314_016988 [Rhamnusium bicolor]